MRYREQLPPPFLEPFVENFYEFETGKDSPPFTVELMVPDSTNGFIFMQTHEMIRHSPHRNDRPDKLNKSYLFGHKTQPVLYYFKNEAMYCLGIRFKPLGLSVFSPVPACTLTDYFVDGQEVFGREFSRVEDRVFETPEFAGKVKVVEAFLCDLVRRHYFTQLPVLKEMVDIMYQGHGNVPVKWLSDRYNMSIKSMERLFLNRIGLTPKLFQRIVRVNHAINNYYRNPHQSLTDITYQSGYYDQTHFVKEMKQFTSLTPTEYFNRRSSHQVEVWQQKLMTERY